MEARLGGGKVNLAANKNKDNDVGGVAKERNEGKEKGGKKRTRGGSSKKKGGREVGKKREVTRSETNKRGRGKMHALTIPCG